MKSTRRKTREEEEHFNLNIELRPIAVDSSHNHKPSKKLSAYNRRRRSSQKKNVVGRARRASSMQQIFDQSRMSSRNSGTNLRDISARARLSRGSIEEEEPEAEDNHQGSNSGPQLKREPSKGKALWNLMKSKSRDLSELADESRKMEFAQSNKMLLLEEHNGIPIKETMKVLYSVRRLKFVWEIVVLTLTLALFYFVTSEPLNRRTAYEQQLTIVEAIQDEEFEGATYKKNFIEIRSTDEFWQWVEGPLLAAVYSTNEEETAGGSSGDGDRGQVDYVNQYLRLVGGIQIRQFRVRENSCTERRRVADWGTKLDTKDQTCWAGYGLKQANLTVPKWATGIAVDASNMYGHWGHCGPEGCSSSLSDEVWYGSGGFYLNIPPASSLGKCS